MIRIKKKNASPRMIRPNKKFLCRSVVPGQWLVLDFFVVFFFMFYDEWVWFEMAELVSWVSK